MKCPSCNEAKMKTVVIPLHEVKFEGVWIVVPNAMYFQCPACAEEVYPLPELKRWSQIRKNQVRRNNT